MKKENGEKGTRKKKAKEGMGKDGRDRQKVRM